jgi:ubiquinone/menaquinone biosynthesis C-methylase UbiE
MRLRGRAHQHAVQRRRIRLLPERLASVIPARGTVLDVGCGDGGIARSLMDQRPDLDVTGIDVLVRPNTLIPVTEFDGREIPFPDESFDEVIFVDVLHHTDDPAVLLAEARRIARRGIVVKDHLVAGVGAKPTLKAMDWFGNAHHGVALPYNYWTEREWRSCFDAIGLRVDVWRTDLALYPIPLRWFLDRELHVLCRLSP